MRWNRLGVGSAELGERLISCWSQPHREYHGLGHLQVALDALAELDGGRWEAVAVWFHDAVWTRPTDPDHAVDERRSASLARRLLADVLTEGQIDEVARLILLTEEHLPGLGDRAGQRVSDADLAMLTTDWPTYAESVAGLRTEAGLDAPHQLPVWAALRADQVGALLGRRRLYRIAPGSWERTARRNLTRELELLGEPPLASRG